MEKPGETPLQQFGSCASIFGTLITIVLAILLTLNTEWYDSPLLSAIVWGIAGLFFISWLFFLVRGRSHADSAKKQLPGDLMDTPNNPGKNRTQPTIGIITALPEEYFEMKNLMVNPQEDTQPGRGAGRRYARGNIPAAAGGSHRIVLCLADQGNNASSVRATQLLQHYPTVEYIFMTGIAGGVPNPQKPVEHVRLGDIVVSDKNGVIQFDFGKKLDGTLDIRAKPVPSGAELDEAARLLLADEDDGAWMKYIEGSKIRRPKPDTDILHDSVQIEKVIRHPADSERVEGRPRVFRGPIGSSNALLKDPVLRDRLRDEYSVKAIEMEGSGIADAAWVHAKEYLVIRGISDYCDSYKDDAWKRYAALAAAAFTRALIESIPLVSAEASLPSRPPETLPESRQEVVELSPMPDWPTDGIIFITCQRLDKKELMKDLVNHGQKDSLDHARAEIHNFGLPLNLTPKWAYLKIRSGLYTFFGGLPGPGRQEGGVKVNGQSFPIPDGKALRNGDLITWFGTNHETLNIRFLLPGLKDSSDTQAISSPPGMPNVFQPQPFSEEERARYYEQDKKYLKAAEAYRRMNNHLDAARNLLLAIDNEKLSIDKARLSMDAARDYLSAGYKSQYSEAMKKGLWYKGGPVLEISIKLPDQPLVVNQHYCLEVIVKNSSYRPAYNVRIELRRHDQPGIIIGECEIPQVSPEGPEWRPQIPFTPGQSGHPVIYEMWLTFAETSMGSRLDPPLVELFKLDIDREQPAPIQITSPGEVKIFQAPVNYAEGDVGFQRLDKKE